MPQVHAFVKHLITHIATYILCNPHDKTKAGSAKALHNWSVQI